MAHRARGDRGEQNAVGKNELLGNTTGSIREPQEGTQESNPGMGPSTVRSVGPSSGIGRDMGVSHTHIQ